LFGAFIYNQRIRHVRPHGHLLDRLVNSSEFQK